MREHGIETVVVIHEDKLLNENTRKTKPTHLSDARQNEGELRVRENADRERTDSESQERGYYWTDGTKVNLVVGEEQYGIEIQQGHKKSSHDTIYINFHEGRKRER